MIRFKFTTIEKKHKQEIRLLIVSCKNNNFFKEEYGNESFVVNETRKGGEYENFNYY